MKWAPRYDRWPTTGMSGAFVEGAEVPCATTRVSNVYLWYLAQVPPPRPPPNILYECLLGLRYYLELENKHLGRVVPSWKLVRPQGSAESSQWRLISSYSYLYHATVETEDGFVHLIKSYMLLSGLLIDKYTFLRPSSWWWRLDFDDLGRKPSITNPLSLPVFSSTYPSASLSWKLTRFSSSAAAHTQPAWISVTLTFLPFRWEYVS